MPQANRALQAAFYLFAWTNQFQLTGGGELFRWLGYGMEMPDGLTSIIKVTKWSVELLTTTLK